MSSIRDGTRRGDFCFHSNKIGNVDDHIRQVPINVDCDPRITCGVSISADCINQPGMKDIKVRRRIGGDSRDDRERIVRVSCELHETVMPTDACVRIVFYRF